MKSVFSLNTLVLLLICNFKKKFCILIKKKLALAVPIQCETATFYYSCNMD